MESMAVAILCDFGGNPLRSSNVLQETHACFGIGMLQHALCLADEVKSGSCAHSETLISTFFLPPSDCDISPRSKRRSAVLAWNRYNPTGRARRHTTITSLHAMGAFALRSQLTPQIRGAQSCLVADSSSRRKKKTTRARFLSPFAISDFLPSFLPSFLPCAASFFL